MHKLANERWQALLSEEGGDRGKGAARYFKAAQEARQAEKKGALALAAGRGAEHTAAEIRATERRLATFTRALAVAKDR